MFQVPRFKSQDYKRGFTAVELLIMLGFVVVLGIVIMPALLGRRSRIELDNTTRQIGSLLREAQSRSMAQASSTSWGVRFENSTTTAPFYALFATSYSTGTVIGYYRLPATVRFATSSIAQGSFLEIIFAQNTGLPSTSTSIILELRGGSGGGPAIASSTVNVNTNGLISF
jgi:type II secretory pathway pseudopilin PulG